jgi:hypothetical protein
MSLAVRKIFLWAAIMLGLGIANRATAQQAATITGRIVDPSGAAVANVLVAIEENSTGLKRSIMSDESGLYTFANVAVGTYTLTASREGFRNAVARDVATQVAQVLRLDVTLQLGALAEKVDVTAVSPMLQTSDSQLGGVVETKAIVDLPLNGRSFTQLMVLMPGAVERTGGTVAGQLGARASGTAFSVNGQRSTTNQYLIDGFMAKEVQHGATAVEPIIDALREFRVQSSNYTAEFGSEAGGQINAVLKSGGNQLHGSVWEFLRNDKLDANNFFNNRAGVARAPFRRNQFGASAGGPVILPGYNGRNRTFIFGAYEGSRVSKGITQLTTVPNAQIRAGNFSGLTTTVRDPLTGQPFPGNIIPADRINAISRTILEKYVPLPNVAGAQTFNWISNDPQRISSEQFNWRIDHRFSDSDSIFGHYLFGDTAFGYPRLFPTDAARQGLRGQNALIAYTHVFGSRTVNEARIGFSRYSQNEYQGRAGTENVVQTLGLCAVRRARRPVGFGSARLAQRGVPVFRQCVSHGGHAQHPVRRKHQAPSRQLPGSHLPARSLFVQRISDRGSVGRLSSRQATHNADEHRSLLAAFP